MIIISILKAITIVLFLNYMNEFKNRFNVVAAFIVLLLHIALDYYCKELIAYFIFSYLITIIYCRICFYGSVTKHVILSALVGIVNFISWVVTLSISRSLCKDTSITQLTTGNTGYLTTYLHLNIFLLLSWLIWVVMKKQYLHWKVECLYGIVSEILIITSIVIGMLESKYVLYVIMSIFQIIIFISYLLLAYCIRTNKIINENIQLTEMLEAQKKDILRREEDYFAARKIRHDIKREYNIYISLLEQGNINEVLCDLKKRGGEDSDMTFVYIENNNKINAVLNEYKEKCKNENIDFCIQVMVNIKKNMEMDMAIIISNLLENAVENINESKSKKISLNIYANNSMLNILCENSILYKDKPIKQKLKSNKESKFLHGIGISGIKKTVMEYGGLTEFYFKDDSFIAHIMIPD